MRREMASYQQGVGQRLKALRKSKGWNQEDAAHAVGISLTTWRNWERGIRAPYERNWAKIGQAFDLDDAKVAGVRGQPPTPLALGQNETGDQLDRIEQMLTEVLELLKPTVERPGAILAAAAQRERERQQQTDASRRRTPRKAANG